MTNDTCGEFLTEVEQLRDNGDTVRLTAHTSSVSADAWNTPFTGAASAPDTPEAEASDS